VQLQELQPIVYSMHLTPPHESLDMCCTMWTNLPQLPGADSAADASWHGSQGFRAGHATANAQYCERVVRLAIRPGQYEATAKCTYQLPKGGPAREVWAGGPGQNTRFLVKPAGGATALKCNMVGLLTGKPASEAMYKRAQSSSSSSLPDLLDTSHAPGPAAHPSPDSLSPAFAAYMLQWFAILPELVRWPNWFHQGSSAGLTALHVYAAAALCAELSLNGTPLGVTGAAAWAVLHAFACNAGQAEHDIERLLQQRFPAVTVMATCAGLRAIPWGCIWSAPGVLSSTQVPHVGTVHSSCAPLSNMDNGRRASAWFVQLQQMNIVEQMANAGAALTALGLREHYHKIVSGAVAASHTPLSSISSLSLACGICSQCTDRTVGADSCVYLELLLHMLRSPHMHEALNHSSLLVRCLVDGMQRGRSARQRELSRVCLTGIFTTAIHTGRGVKQGAATMVPSGARILSRPAVPHHVISMVCSAMLMRVRITAMSMQAAAAQERLFPGSLLDACPNTDPSPASTHAHGQDDGALSLLVMQGSVEEPPSPGAGDWEEGEGADTFDSMPQAFHLATRRLVETSHALQSSGSAPVVVLRGKPQLLHLSQGARGGTALWQQVLVHTSQQDFFTPSFGPIPSPMLSEDAFSLDDDTDNPADSAVVALSELPGPLPPPHQAVVPTVERLDTDTVHDAPLQVHVRGLQLEEGREALSPPSRRHSVHSRPPPPASGAVDKPAPMLPQHFIAHRRWAAWSMRWDPSVIQSQSAGVKAPHADAGVGVMRELIAFISGAIALSHDVAQRVTSATHVSPAARAPRGGGRTAPGRRTAPAGSYAMHISGGGGADDLDTSFIRDVRHLVRCLVHCTCRLSSAVCGEYDLLQSACTAVMAQGGEHATYTAWTLMRKWPRSDSERCIVTLRMLVASVKGWWTSAASRSISVNTPSSAFGGPQSPAENSCYAPHQLPSTGRLRSVFIGRLTWCLSSPHASLCTAAVKCVLPGNRGLANVASILSTDLDMAEAVAQAAALGAGDGHWNTVVQRNLSSLERALKPVLTRLQAAHQRTQMNNKAVNQPSGAHIAKFDKNPSAKQVSVELDEGQGPVQPSAGLGDVSRSTRSTDAGSPTHTAHTDPAVESSPAPAPQAAVTYKANTLGSPGRRIAVAIAPPSRAISPPGSPTDGSSAAQEWSPGIFLAPGRHVWQPPVPHVIRTSRVRIPSPTPAAESTVASPHSPSAVQVSPQAPAWTIPQVRLADAPSHPSKPQHEAASVPEALLREGVLVKGMSLDERSFTLAAPTASLGVSLILAGASSVRRTASEPVKGASPVTHPRGIEIFM